MLCSLYYPYFPKKQTYIIKNINLLETHSLFFFLREMHLPMIPFHQRATSVPSRQLILEHWVVSPCLLPLLLNTFFCHWFASLVTSLCKYLSNNSNVYSNTLQIFFYFKWTNASPGSTEELNPTQVVRTLLPLILESSTESVAEISSTSLERILGPAESDAFLARIYERLVTGCHNIIANHSDPSRYNNVAQLWFLHLFLSFN